MAPTVDYFLAPQSPWTYLGHARLVAMAHAAGAAVRLLPIDLGRVFPVSGGLALPRRAPQRQAYRLVELRRHSEFLGLPLVLQPRFFPVQADAAARLIIAAEQTEGTDAALRLAGAILAAVWADQRDVSDPSELAALVRETGLDAGCPERARDPSIQERYEAYTQMAIDAGVFGAPTYRIGDELFWGQDRLDFVGRRLAAA